MTTASRGSPEHGESAEADFTRRSVAMHSDPRFVELRRRLRVFIFPMSAAFLAWYLLYVLMSAYARDVMSIVLFGHVNVALLFGLLQFVTTFGIAILYARYAGRRLDPLAEQIHDELTTGSAAPAADDEKEAGA
ncbi:DUF485 domain-containing protein [Marinactinospora rubrisoli]|uniref:DUF485 domain-containing protein n=1 Tax=Marinactinospora rubrisoli TaxID=2715399 RepID=A0ABW2KD00_9ACTN